MLTQLSMIRLTLLATVSLSVFTNVSAQCDYGEVVACIHPIALNTVKGLPAETIDDICNKLPKTAKCVNDLGCKESDDIFINTWQGLKESLEYACGDESVKEVMVNDQCLKSNSTTEKLLQCYTALFHGINPSNVSSSCRALDTFLKCLQEGTSACGSHVTSVFVTFTYRRIRPANNLSNCTLSELPGLTASSTGVQSSSTMLSGVMAIITFNVLSKVANFRNDFV